MNILFVCTGNTCRSPMAEAIFRELLRRRGRDDTCGSAGLSAEEGFPASPNAQLVCREIGLDLSRHRSRNLRREDLLRTDLFAVMTASHARALLSAGVPAEKIAVLGEGIPDPYGGGPEIYRRCCDSLSAALGSLADRLFQGGSSVGQ